VVNDEEGEFETVIAEKIGHASSAAEKQSEQMGM
jgi:hypothetical protein